MNRKLSPQLTSCAIKHAVFLPYFDDTVIVPCFFSPSRLFFVLFPFLLLFVVIILDHINFKGQESKKKGGQNKEKGFVTRRLPWWLGKSDYSYKRVVVSVMNTKHPRVEDKIGNREFRKGFRNGVWVRKTVIQSGLKSDVNGAVCCLGWLSVLLLDMLDN